MAAPRNPIRVEIEHTFNQWREETNAVIDIVNYYLNNSSGYLEIDSATFTNVDVSGGTVQNVTINDSTLEPTISGFFTINQADLNNVNISTSIFNNGSITESVLQNVTGSGYWNVDDATLNIATGTETERNAKGVGGNSELFWDRTNQQLRIFDGSVPGGRIAAIDGLTRDAAIGLIIALG